MRVFLALIVGVILGGAALWYYNTTQGKSRVDSTGQHIESAAKSAGDTLQQKIHDWNLTPQNIKDELARSGQVVRRKAEEAGQAINDATADARITTAIKAKLVANRDLPGLGISVNTTGGVVTLSSRAEGHFALISVADTGLGIPPDEIGHVFERFRRVRSGAAQSIPGTGLGLTIVKQIVEMHGGRIWVESAVGHGSAFHFTVPLAAANQAPLQLRHA